MYNSELKAQFIRDYIGDNYNAQKVCVSIFNFTEINENAWGADICTRSVGELQPIFNYLNGVRASSFRRTIILHQYLKWCAANGIPGATKEYEKVKLPEVETMRERSVSSPSQVQYYLNALFDPENDMTVDNIYRCYYWLAFIGIDKEDAPKITVDNVDIGERKIYYDNNEYTIYKEALPAISICVKQNSFVKKGYGDDILLPRVPGKQLLRGVRAEFSNESFSVILSNRSGKSFKAGKTKKKMTYDRFWLSGLFCRTYSQEIAGDIVDFSDTATRFHNSREQKRANANYAYEYEIWKATFN